MPLLNVGVIVVEFPVTIVVVPMKLVMMGVGTTWMVTPAVTDTGVVAAFVTVKV